jgi:hypothetical protein
MSELHNALMETPAGHEHTVLCVLYFMAWRGGHRKIETPRDLKMILRGSLEYARFKIATRR